MTNNKFSLLSLVIIALLLTSCGTPGNPSDPLGDFPTLTPFPTPNSPTLPPIESVEPVQSNDCGNSYWPIELGASWTYFDLDMSGNVQETIIWEVSSIIPAPEGMTFSITSSSPAFSGGDYRCVNDAILTSEGFTYLPAPSEFIEGNTWRRHQSDPLMFVGYETVTVPAGTFTAAKFVAQSAYYFDMLWVDGVGLVRTCTERCRVLASYSADGGTGNVLPPTPTATSSGSQGNNLPTQGFDSDVFSSGECSRSGDSVFVDTANGWLHIEPNGANNDNIYCPMTLQLPVVIETRMRLVSGGRNYFLPAFSINTVRGEETIGITYLSDHGWMFLDYDDVYDYGVPGENVWIRVIAILRSNEGELWMSYEGTGGDFSLVTKRSWNVPKNYSGITFRQPWDAAIDVDYFLITPLESALDKSRVRYIIADIQLSGLDNYYRSFPDDINAVEALRLWDSGVRVVNIAQFERKIVASTWQIVYAGTDTPVNGMDIVLSSDQ